MIDREKVIATAIEQLDWYFNEDDGGAAERVTKIAYQNLRENIFALLREQEPRVMTPYEVRAEYEIVWLERKDISCEVAILQRIACSMYEFPIMGTDEMPSLLESQYGKTWRCWNVRPTEQQMRKTKWEGEKDAE